jgi:hypothetical protein
MYILSDPISEKFSEKDRKALVDGLEHMNTLSNPSIRIEGIERIDDVSNLSVINTVLRVANTLHSVVGSSNDEIRKLEQKLLDTLEETISLNLQVRDLTDDLRFMKQDPNINSDALNAVINVALAYGTEGTTDGDDDTVIIFSKASLKAAVSDAIFSYNNYE